MSKKLREQVSLLEELILGAFTDISCKKHKLSGREACKKLTAYCEELAANKPKGYYGDARGNGYINEEQASHIAKLYADQKELTDM